MTPGRAQRSGGSSDIDAAVRQVIGGAVDAGEVIDLFAAAGLDAARLDILSAMIFFNACRPWSRRTWRWRRCGSC